MVLFTWNPASGNYAASVKDGAITVRQVADFHLLNLEALEELDKLDCEIFEELQIKELLQSSTRELAATIDDLEKRLEDIENEGSEWKTRFLNQSEMNQMLERQVVLLTNQIEDTKLLLKDGKVSKAFADMTDSALERSIRMGQKEKMRLETEIREMEQRIEQEAKAFHRGNEERRQLLNELSSSKQVVIQKHQKSQLDLLQNDLKKLSQLSTRSNLAMNGNHVNASLAMSMYTSRGGMGPIGGSSSNLPPNQRILDPKKGPIKKAAAVKKLPALGSYSASSF